VDFPLEIPALLKDNRKHSGHIIPLSPGIMAVDRDRNLIATGKIISSRI